MLLLRRALRDYPSHSRAAAVLATMLHRAGRAAEAREVLLDTLREVEGIASSQQRLAETARSLGIDLGLDLPPAAPGPSPSSTATGVSPMGGPEGD
jgi:predicted Zn-dependent protease